MDLWTFTEVSLAEDGALLHVPEQALTLLGLWAHDAHPATPAALLGLEPEGFNALLEDVRNGATPVHFLSRPRPDGVQATLRASLRARPEGGFSLSLIDLSALLEGAPLLTPGLFPALSHELRNPLSSVKMAVQTLARNPELAERDRRRVSIAHREVRTLERLLWLVSEAGRDSAPHPEAVPADALLEDAVDVVRLELEEQGLLVAPDLDGPWPRLLVDRARTRGILGPLLLTVARAGLPEQRLHVRGLTAADGRFELQLEDPNARLAKGETERAFVPFAFSPTRTTGLLLPAVRTVMESQDGRAAVRPLSAGGVRYVLGFRTAVP